MAVIQKEWVVFYVDLSVKPPTLLSFDDTMGTPADAARFRDHTVVAVFQRMHEGRETDQIGGAHKYVYLTLQAMWTGSSDEEIAEYAHDGVELSVTLNGGWVPTEIFQRAFAVAQTDDGLPGAVGPGGFGIDDELRFNALVDNAVRLIAGDDIEPVRLEKRVEGEE